MIILYELYILGAQHFFLIEKPIQVFPHLYAKWFAPARSGGKQLWVFQEILSFNDWDQRKGTATRQLEAGLTSGMAEITELQFCHQHHFPHLQSAPKV